MEFTKTQKAILEVLADGRPHHRSVLKDAIGDPLATYQNLNWHMTAIRRKLHPVGQDIVCVLLGKSIHYRHVRMLASPIE